MKRTDSKIAIVGAGASTSIFLINFLRQQDKRRSTPLHITVFDHTRWPFRGIAYGTENPVFKLNVPAERMSAFEDDPADFLNFLRVSYPHTTWHGHDFVERRTYGQYLQTRVRTATEQAQKQNIHVKFCAESVLSCYRQTDGQYRIDTECGSNEGHFQYVLLATGNSRPTLQMSGFAEVEQAGCLIVDPWDEVRAQEIRPNEEVIIIGTGLTMVDWVLGLRNSNHQAKITAISRRGLWPLPYGKGSPPLPWPELLHCRTITSLLREFRRKEREHVAQGREWQDLMNSIRPLTSVIWENLDSRERKRFVRRLKPFWEVHRHRLPEISRQRILSDINAGTLEILAGRPLEVVRNPRSAFQLRYQARSSDSIREINGTWIINATGPLNDFRSSAPAVYASLFEQNLGMADPTGFGVNVDENSQLINRSGVPVPGIYAIGSVTKGRFFEITSIPDIRKQAKKLALLFSQPETTQPTEAIYA